MSKAVKKKVAKKSVKATKKIILKKSEKHPRGYSIANRQKSRGEPADRLYQFQLCMWIAMGFNNPQILDLLWDKFEIKMDASNIDHNYRTGKKWMPVVKYLKTRYLKNISRIPIADKAHRLAKLDYIVQEALTWRTKSRSAYGTVKELKTGVAVQAIESARKEIEGDKAVNINVDNRKFQQISITGKTTPDLISEVTEKLKNR